MNSEQKKGRHHARRPLTFNVASDTLHFPITYDGAVRMWKVQWGEKAEKEMSSLGELDSLLDHLDAEYHGDRAIIVSLEAPENGGTLSLGVGRELSILNYIPASADPPYFSSVGELTGDETIGFYFMGQRSEFPIRNTVPIHSAREAIRYFFKTGRLVDKIKWEPD